MLLTWLVVAVVATFIGGLSAAARRWLSRDGMAGLLSARAGILLAVAFTELLPQAWALHRATAGWAALAAFALLFATGHFAMTDPCPEYLQNCRIHYLGWAAFAALFAHSFVDGFNLALAFAADARAGLAVGLALGLHKLADGFTLVSLFQQAGYSPSRQRLALSVVAAATPVGAGFSHFGFARLPTGAEAALLGFAAGSFIYIAATDALPRLHRSSDKSGLGYFGLGLVGMAALKLL